MELNRLLEIAHEKAMCAFCADCGDDACFACSKVKGIRNDELREYHTAVSAALRKAAEYEQLEREGRLVVLPCAKNGAALFFVDKQRGEIYKEAYTNGLGLYWTNDSDIGDYLPLSCIGKTVFLTRAEAEAALGGGAHG